MRNNPIRPLARLVPILCAALWLVAPCTVGAASPQSRSDLVLQYTQPAKIPMNEALPIGNGRMGGMIFGGAPVERIAFNEDSLWTGDKNPSGAYDSMGDYQAFGNVTVTLPGHETPASYRRDLDISDATSHVAYQAGGVTYRREYFCSHPDQVLVARFTADRPGGYTGVVALTGTHGETPVQRGARMRLAGSLPNGERYEAQVQVIADGGAISPAPNGGVAFAGCNSVILLLACGTSYVMDPQRGYIGADPGQRVERQLAGAAAKSYTALRAAHVRDYQALFDRVQLSLGNPSGDRADLPTNLRKRSATDGSDPALEALLFQYGRYLMISCSRPGSLPANLQGLWNDSNSPPWHSDYHTNINIQMNYWPAETTNLSECQLPLFDLVESQLPAWRAATASSADYALPAGAPMRGFAVRTSHNINGGMGWQWDKTANAWYCRHFWEHYEFTNDRQFLRTTAYPILKETCRFWEDHLKALPDGRLVVPNGWSPEHGPREDGVSYNQEIVWDLFTNYLDAGAALDIDPEYREKITAMRSKLVEPGIGRWGQLQEWMEDVDDPNDHHRHTSHLFAVFPGRQIGITTPALIAAAHKSLVARSDGGDVREWSFAWRTALYARMHDGDAAHREMDQLFFDRNSCPNLFGLHPPMQIDGNFGITAAVAEMLLQSQNPGEIELLPALPTQWRDGFITGLKARGGFVVSESWQAGKLESVAIHSTSGTGCALRYGGLVVPLQIKPGQTVQLNGSLRAT